MDAKGLAVVVTAFSGCLIAMQAPINSKLGKTVGTFQAAAVSFAIGLLVLIAIVAVVSNFGDVSEARGAPWWYFIGGVLGAIYVSTVLVSVRTLGAGGVTAATIAGQLTFSMVIDQMGWLGVTRQPVSALRLLGVAFLALGVFLIVRD